MAGGRRLRVKNAMRSALSVVFGRGSHDDASLVSSPTIAPASSLTPPASDVGKDDATEYVFVTAPIDTSATIPTDVLCHVMSFLPRHDLLQARLVSRKWSAVDARSWTLVAAVLKHHKDQQPLLAPEQMKGVGQVALGAGVIVGSIVLVAGVLIFVPSVSLQVMARSGMSILFYPAIKGWQVGKAGVSLLKEYQPASVEPPLSIDRWRIEGDADWDDEYEVVSMSVPMDELCNPTLVERSSKSRSASWWLPSFIAPCIGI